MLFTTSGPLSACHPFCPLICVGLPSYTRAGVFLPALPGGSWGGCWAVLPQHPKTWLGPCGCVMERIWVVLGASVTTGFPGQGQPNRWDRDSPIRGTGTARFPLPLPLSPHPALATPGTIPSHPASALPWLQGWVCPQGFPWKGREERLRTAGKTPQSPNSALPIYKPSS